jgi:hypothetical protein
LLTAAGGCTGDAYLGSLAGAAPLGAASADAGVPRPGPDAAAAGAGAIFTADAGTASAPLELTLRAAGSSGGELRLQCPDTCVNVALAANGGTPPYVYSWEDGTSALQRMFCPSSDEVLRASVRDATGKLQTASLSVQRVSCKTEQLCLSNPSFDGAPTIGAEWLVSSALGSASWDDCRSANQSSASSQPRIVNASSGDEFPMGSDGNTYLYLPARGGTRAEVGQTLCAPLSRGSVYYLKLDLAYAAEDRTGAPLEPGQLAVYASSATCQADTLLWTSPGLHTGFRTYCFAIQPTVDASALVLTATGPAGADAAVFVDHLVATTTCP